MAIKKRAETVALAKEDEQKFKQNVQSLKKKIKHGEVEVDTETKTKKKTRKRENRGLIYLSHLPHGFYEEEMTEYFTQFGEVTNARVVRSNKTDKSKGFGFVEFRLPEVADVVAETMNNYLMFKRRIEVRSIPLEEQKPNLFNRFIKKKIPYEKRSDEFVKKANTHYGAAKTAQRNEARKNKINKMLAKLQAMGIQHQAQINEIKSKKDLIAEKEETLDASMNEGNWLEEDKELVNTISKAVKTKRAKNVSPKKADKNATPTKDLKVKLLKEKITKKQATLKLGAKQKKAKRLASPKANIQEKTSKPAKKINKKEEKPMRNVTETQTNLKKEVLKIVENASPRNVRLRKRKTSKSEEASQSETIEPKTKTVKTQEATKVNAIKPEKKSNKVEETPQPKANKRTKKNKSKETSQSEATTKQTKKNNKSAEAIKPKKEVAKSTKSKKVAVKAVAKRKNSPTDQNGVTNKIKNKKSN